MKKIVVASLILCIGPIGLAHGDLYACLESPVADIAEAFIHYSMASYNEEPYYMVSYRSECSSEHVELWQVERVSIVGKRDGSPCSNQIGIEGKRVAQSEEAINTGEYKEPIIYEEVDGMDNHFFETIDLACVYVPWGSDEEFLCLATVLNLTVDVTVERITVPDEIIKTKPVTEQSLYAAFTEDFDVQPEGTFYARVNVQDALNVRDTPSLEAKIIAKLAPDTKVAVKKSSTEHLPWVLIKVPKTQKTGWAHSDYLTFTTSDSEKRTGSNDDIEFARVSKWSGDPQYPEKWWEKGEEPTEKPFYGVHGVFEEGTDFTVFFFNREPPVYAVATRTIAVDFKYNIYPVTKIVFDTQDSIKALEPYLAVVGKSSNCELIQLDEVTDPEKRKFLLLPVALQVPNYTNIVSQMHGNTTPKAQANPMTFQLAGKPAWLIHYALSYRYVTDSGTVLFWQGEPFVMEINCGKEILFFRVDKKIYAWQHFHLCDSGGESVYVREFNPDSGKVVTVYENGDYSD